MAFKFRSNSDEIKYYIKQLLKDGKPHNRKEIIRYVKDTTKNETYTDGQFAGAFQNISRDERYSAVRRGVYQYVGESNLYLDEAETIDKEKTISEISYDVLNETVEKLKSEIGKINPLDMDEADYLDLDKVKKIIEKIEDFKEKLCK